MAEKLFCYEVGAHLSPQASVLCWGMQLTDDYSWFYNERIQNKTCLTPLEKRHQAVKFDCILRLCVYFLSILVSAVQGAYMCRH